MDPERDKKPGPQGPVSSPSRPPGAFIPVPAPTRPDPTEPGAVRPRTVSVPTISSLHFEVTPDLPEVKALAGERGWAAHGWTRLTIAWQHLVYTTDGWQTTRRLSSHDVPSPVSEGFFYLSGVAPGTEVEFAVHVGVRACGQTEDAERASADLWFNNDGKNYRQHTR